MRFGTLLISLCISFSSSVALAHQFFISYDQSKQTHTVLDSVANIDAAGSTLTASFDLSDSWQWSLNLGRASGDEAYSERATTELDTTHLSSTLSYYTDAWAYTLNVGRYRDTLDVFGNQGRTIYSSNSSSPSLSTAVQYQFPVANWYVELDVGLSYGKYEFESIASKGRDTSILLAEDANSLSASIGVTVSYWTELMAHQNVYLGASLYWDQVLDSDNTQTRVSKKVRVSQPVKVRRQQFEGGFHNENSGQLSLFVSYGFASAWSISTSYAYPLNSDYSSDSLSVMLGYQF